MSLRRFVGSLLFDFSSNTSAPPTSNQIRLDAPPPYAAVTGVMVRYLTSDGIDAYWALMATDVGSQLVLQDKNDHTVYVELETTAAPVDRGSYIEIAARFTAGAGALANQGAVLGIFVPAGDVPFVPVPPVFEWISLDDAKMHLRILDTLHDADVAQKLALSCANIADYLKDWQPVAEWTTTTLPGPAKTATLLMLTHLYEHRGDDMTPSGAGGTPDEDVWAAIERVCARLRAPVIR